MTGRIALKVYVEPDPADEDDDGCRTLHVDVWTYTPRGRAGLYDPGDPEDLALDQAWWEGCPPLRPLELVDVLEEHWDALVEAVRDYEAANLEAGPGRTERW